MSQETIRRKLAAILSADAVGYSRLMADDEVTTARTLRSHLERMEAAIARRGGRVVDEVGDNLLAEFVSVVEAAACASEIQRDLAERNAALPDSKRMPFRIGLHLGDVIIEGDRIRGDGVNVAARLEGLAPPGGFAISGPAFDQVEGRLGIDFADLGELMLKNIPRPTRVYVARLGTEIGDARREEVAPPHVATPPRPRTRFIGRDDARRRIAAALDADRLVTLTGVGGCGKSRLALQVADDVQAFAAGARGADLTSATASEQVPAVVATAAGLVSQRTGIDLSAEEQLVHSIGDRHLLLVLDNCEHVVEGAARLADLLLGRCPRLAILATSREPLDIDGEHVWQVPPLELPSAEASFDEGRGCEAIRLFADRAGAARAGFTLTPEIYGAVRQICERLDGIPLAIELAAARVRHLGLEEIAARLDDRFRLLGERSRRSDRRHQTLLATIEWSDGLLGELQRTLFYRLSVFAGGFALDAVEAVCGTPPLDPAEILEHLGALVDRSLVVADEQRGETRYRLLETIRAYAAARLAAVGERDVLRTQHRDWFARLAERHTRWLLGAGLVGPQGRSWDPAAGVAHDDVANLRAATEWSLESGDEAASLHLAGATGNLLLDMGHPSDAVDLTRRALSLPARAARDAALGAQIVLAKGLMEGGDFGAAFDHYEEVAVEASRQPGFEHVVSIARSWQCVAAPSTGKGDAETLAKLAVESARACGYEQGERMGLSQLGATRLIAGRFSEAAEILRGLLDRFTKSPVEHYTSAAYHVVATVLAGDEAAAAQAYARLMTLRPAAEDPFTRSWLAWNTGRARALWCAASGNHAGAEQALSEALERQRRAPVPLADADYLVTGGAIAFLAGDPERAARLLGAARSAMDRYRSWRGHDAGPIYVTFRKRCEEALGPERARALLREGRALPADQALAQLRSTLENRGA